MSAPVVTACPVCELVSAQLSGEKEAEHLAGIHNRVHHGGRPDAVVLVVAVAR